MAYADLNELTDRIGDSVRVANPHVVMILLADDEGNVSILSHDMTPENQGEFFHALAHKYMDGTIEVIHSADIAIPEPVPATKHVGNQ